MSNRWAELSDDNVILQVIIDDGLIVSELPGTWINLADDQPNQVGWTLLADGSTRPPKAYPSWTWDNEKKAWVAPIPMPQNFDDNGKLIYMLWDEDAGKWVGLNEAG